MQEPKERISNPIALIIICLAVLVDLVQGLLTVTLVGIIFSMMLGVFASFTLWLTFTLHGVKYSGTAGLKKIAASFGTMVIEMVPFLDALPLVTIGACIIIFETKKEDREAKKAWHAEQERKQKEALAQRAAMQKVKKMQAQAPSETGA